MYIYVYITWYIYIIPGTYYTYLVRYINLIHTTSYTYMCLLHTLLLHKYFCVVLCDHRAFISLSWNKRIGTDAAAVGSLNVDVRVGRGVYHVKNPHIKVSLVSSGPSSPSLMYDLCVSCMYCCIPAGRPGGSSG